MRNGTRDTTKFISSDVLDTPIVFIAGHDPHLEDEVAFKAKKQGTATA